jgi:chromosome segregation ATPase
VCAEEDTLWERLAEANRKSDATARQMAERIATLEAELDEAQQGESVEQGMRKEGEATIAALEAQIAGNAKLFAKMVEDLARVEAERDVLKDALREISFMSMDVPAAAGGGDEARDRMHAQQAWRAINVAARALDAARTQGKGQDAPMPGSAT